MGGEFSSSACGVMVVVIILVLEVELGQFTMDILGILFLGFSLGHNNDILWYAKDEREAKGRSAGCLVGSADERDDDSMTRIGRGEMEKSVKKIDIMPCFRSKLTSNKASRSREEEKKERGGHPRSPCQLLKNYSRPERWSLA